MKITKKALTVLLLDLEIRKLAHADALAQFELARLVANRMIHPLGAREERSRCEVHVENCRQALNRATKNLVELFLNPELEV